MTIIAVQCRLASSRLPNKALLPLGEKALLGWTLSTLKKVTADEYWLACDEDSFSELSPIAESEGWNCFQGPKNDVLERYCLLAEKTGAQTILRATADNPFLFYEAAFLSLIEFEKNSCDYFAFTGLPHGSGIEVFSAKSLLKAKQLTDNPYDHEHVGPSLYNHPESFAAVFKSAPYEWTQNKNGESYRTTVDTISDYRKVLRMHAYLQKKNCHPPYSAKDIFLALHSYEVENPILFIPAVAKGRGTGHIRRVIELIDSLKKNFGIFSNIFLQDQPSTEVLSIIENAKNASILCEYEIVTDISHNGEYGAIILDSFVTDKRIFTKIYGLAPIFSIDEGSTCTKYIDYQFDIIPPIADNKVCNAFKPELLNLPKRVKDSSFQIKKILISIGGEDPANFSKLIHESLNAAFQWSDVLVHNTNEIPIKNLRDSIGSYDLVITHYGLTAFEACSAGCAVITVATSPIHKKLSKKYGLVCLEKKECKPKNLVSLLHNVEDLLPKKLLSLFSLYSNSCLDSFIKKLLYSNHYNCPICGVSQSLKINPIVSRDAIKTIRKCYSCGLNYISFCVQEKKEYSKNYFFDEYKNQYGKTYLEDFDSIKKQGLRRVKNILMVQKTSKKGSLLDVGCAYGPFLSACKDLGFEPFGTDISKDAVEYVSNTLKFSAKEANFASNFNATNVFGSNSPKNGLFDALTMWFVIEHFQNLDVVLQNVSKTLKIGGVFAFSTPNACGISRKMHKKNFFTQSPYDHFSIWNVHKAAKVLKKYGFCIKKIESTGIHKNRFPSVLKLLPNGVIIFFSRIFKLGDTFEVYSIKTKDVV